MACLVEKTLPVAWLDEKLRHGRGANMRPPAQNDHM